MDFDREMKKFKKKMREFRQDFDDFMDRGEVVGRRYGRELHHEMRNLKEQVDRHVGDVFRKHDIKGKFKHAMAHLNLMSDVEDKGNNVVIKVALPGVERKDVVLKITNNHVEIHAKRREHMEVKSKHGYKKEVSEKMYHRLIPLPSHIEHERARAEYKHGLLKITIPKKKVDKKLGLR